jgi:hypothetical protein
MKNSTVHGVLSAIHRLLSEYEATDFAHASRYAGVTPQLREVLQALARESKSFASGSSKQRAVAPPRSDSNGDLGSRDGRDGQKAALAAMLSRSQRFESNRSILQFAREVGLTVLPRPKESRDRLATRVAEAILSTPEPKRSQVVSRLARGGDNQTQGWIDVIKGRA